MGVTRQGCCFVSVSPSPSLCACPSPQNPAYYSPCRSRIPSRATLPLMQPRNTASTELSQTGPLGPASAVGHRLPIAAALSARRAPLSNNALRRLALLLVTDSVACSTHAAGLLKDLAPEATSEMGLVGQTGQTMRS